MMKKQSFLFVSCDEAQHICDKAQYDEASSWEKFKLNIRLSYCKITRAYYKSNAMLTKRIKESKVECLDSTSKKNMKKELDKAIKEQAN
ncbi:hypothetical protein [Seonamhaeicola aphaedonensis]|uniref:Glycine dehydrogenase n=1 Tax=Seonamhaeicola aphaedonensis TaxID=1461338 RepID=A0A3D9HG56_9FLAO|nr:hypothetical protein [Seonamhaeicola aphaedonensis]RED48467.1 hypothetical protein DFQ02_104313 [Seonamhaeicola aphaedonensis]